MQALETARCGLSSEAALAAIAALPSLRCLQLDVHHTLLVGRLSALTQLQQLSLHGQLLAEGGEGEDGGGADLEALVLESASQLEAALAPLQQLTCLMLHVVPMARVPQALTGLPLQRLMVDTVIWPGPPDGLPWPCPALESLRWLGLNWQASWTGGTGRDVGRLGQKHLVVCARFVHALSWEQVACVLLNKGDGAKLVHSCLWLLLACADRLVPPSLFPS